MKRIADNPAASKAMGEIRETVGSSEELHYIRWWDYYHISRKSIHLEQAGLAGDARSWDQFNSDEKYRIRESLRRHASVAVSDARVMGAIE
ncbi:MAG: hypothetical protein N0E58_15890 [Candidatus Thiodiazotropha endolucinida]|uniref:Uncharacterized protein n=1 Tax=Candidatus Thiodiazotropha taylori TaxID=2792791 RepID=A0A9E4NLW9_9GAMM|nr:hypothetical protein [Candidatus Thiodiazotropha taylori]MCW4237729.1 hypothetical protein [Candidatus Thiodiazotropha endolucinida]